MNKNRLGEQAAELEHLLPQLMRRLFTLTQDSMVNELPVAQVRVLAILQDGPRTFSSLSVELGISLSAVTQIADRLERSGMVDRATGIKDRRTRYLRLTVQGSETMLARRESRVRRTEQVLGQSSEEEREQALYALTTLYRAAVSAALFVTCEAAA